MVLLLGIMDNDLIQYFRRSTRREYLRRHEKQRRATAKAEGARRIDVTLRGDMLADFATVRRYIEGLNRIAAERSFLGSPVRLSDTAVIKMALSRAAADILDEDARATNAGQLRVLAAE